MTGEGTNEMQKNTAQITALMDAWMETGDIGDQELGLVVTFLEQGHAVDLPTKYDAFAHRILDQSMSGGDARTALFATKLSPEAETEARNAASTCFNLGLIGKAVEAATSANNVELRGGGVATTGTEAMPYTEACAMRDAGKIVGGADGTYEDLATLLNEARPTGQKAAQMIVVPGIER